jgi:hypothetical protein
MRNLGGNGLWEGLDKSFAQVGSEAMIPRKQPERGGHNGAGLRRHGNTHLWYPPFENREG